MTDDVKPAEQPIAELYGEMRSYAELQKSVWLVVAELDKLGTEVSAPMSADLYIATLRAQYARIAAMDWYEVTLSDLDTPPSDTEEILEYEVEAEKNAALKPLTDALVHVEELLAALEEQKYHPDWV